MNNLETRNPGTRPLSSDLCPLTSRFSSLFFVFPLTARVLAMVMLAIFSLGQFVQAANTENDYTGSSTGSLLTTTNWSLGHVPTVSEDAVFTATTGIRSLTAGSLTVGSFNVTASTGTFSIRNNTSTATNSTLTLGGAGDLGNGVSGTAGDLLFAASGSTFNIIGPNGSTGTGVLNVVLGQSGNFNAAGTITISSVISDGGSGFGITKTGAGTLTLSGTNTYTGATTINGGILSVTSLANGGSSSGIGASTNIATNLVLNGGTLRYTGAAVSTDRLFSVGTNGGTIDASGSSTLSFTNGGSIGFNGQTGARTLTLTGSSANGFFYPVIGDNSGATSLTKSGAAQWTLVGLNTYTGATTINGGYLTVSTLANGLSNSNIGASSNAATNLILNGGELFYTGFTSVSTDRLFSVGTNTGIIDVFRSGVTLNFTNTGSIGFNGQTGARTLELTGAGNGSLAAVLGDNSGATSLNIQGFGGTTWTLSGLNSYTGMTLISGGTLSASTLANGLSNSNIGASSNAATNLVFINGTLQYTGAAVSTDRLFSIAGPGGTGTLDASGSGAVNFTNTGSMGFNSGQTGTRTLILTGTNTGNNTLAAVIGDNSGATGLTKSGAGTWILSGANTYTGATTVGGGTLSIDNNNTTTARLAGTSGITVNSGGTLLLSQSGGTPSTDRISNTATMTLNGGTFNTGGLSERGGTVSAPTAGIGALTLIATSTIDFGAGSTSMIEFSGVGAHTVGTILNITNWDGIAGTGGGTEALLFAGTTTAFTSIYNQADVIFDGVTGYNAIQFTGFYEITEVPEPSTWFAAGLAFVVAGYSQRKRLSRLLIRA